MNKDVFQPITRVLNQGRHHARSVAQFFVDSTRNPDRYLSFVAGFLTCVVVLTLIFSL